MKAIVYTPGVDGPGSGPPPPQRQYFSDDSDEYDEEAFATATRNFAVETSVIGLLNQLEAAVLDTQSLSQRLQEAEEHLNRIKREIISLSLGESK